MTEQVLESDPYLTCAIHSESAVPQRAWQAGGLVVDLELRRLTRDGERIVLQETPLRLLCLLLAREGRPLSRRDLHQALWPRYDWDSFERNLNSAMRKLRRAIGDDAREPRLIETLRASGYRWIGPAPRPCSTLPEPTVAPEPPAVRPAGSSDGWASADAGMRPIDSDPHLARQAPRARRWPLFAAIAGLAAVVAAGIGLWQPATAPSSRWIEISASGEAEPKAFAAVRDPLLGLVASDAPGASDPVAVKVDFRDGVASRAAVSGRGATTSIALDETTLGRERLLAEVATRLPREVLRRRGSRLPPPAERAFADAGSLMIGANSVATVERAITLLETTLSAAPDHAGALRMYARAQRVHAVLARDPKAARERREIARTALRRAIAVEPASAALAGDVAVHLFWGEGNVAAAADWFALARREAPQDAEILHAYAWFALADNRTGEAMSAINEALALAPLNVPLHSDLGWFYFRTGRFDDALRQCRLALEMSASDASAKICEWRALAELGHVDQAWQALRKHSPDWLDAESARAFDAMPPQVAWRNAMRLGAKHLRATFGAGFDSACFEAIAGERDAAVADLAVAESIGDPGLLLARVTPELVRLLGASETRRLARSDRRPPSPIESG